MTWNTSEPRWIPVEYVATDGCVVVRMGDSALMVCPAQTLGGGGGAASA